VLTIEKKGGILAGRLRKAPPKQLGGKKKFFEIQKIMLDNSCLV
jgi:hypothetical protein